MHRILALSLSLCCLSACDSSTTPRSAINSAAVKSATDAERSSAADAGTKAAAPATNSVENSASPAAYVDVQLADHAQLLEHVNQYKGRVVVIDVWSTSCLPCMKEFPNLVELARRWPEDVVCLSMNVDYIGLPNKQPASYIPAAQDFLKSQAADVKNMVNLVSSEADSDVLSKLDVESMPAVLVFNRAGKQIAKLTTDNAGDDGLTYAGDIVPQVEKLVEQR